MKRQMAAENFHHPYSRIVTGARLAFVFTHGIMGSPRQFDELIAGLGQDCSIENILLPGHGATARAYAASNMAAWQRSLDDTVARLAASHDRIILVGHSMGGLLSVLTALANPDKVCGLFMIATPLRLGISGRFVRRSLKIAFIRQGGNPEVDIANQTNSVYFPAWHSYLQGSSHVPELFWKIHQVRRVIGRLTCRVHAIWSEQDEIVNPRSADLLPDTSQFSTTMLKESGHYRYTPEESRLIRETFLRFAGQFAAD